MTAAGKTTAARAAAGDRILVRIYTPENSSPEVMEQIRSKRGVGPAWTKTGEGVTTARILSVEAFLVTGRRRAARVYKITTTEGAFECFPAQTMILTPEDNAGIKRAHVAALAEAAERKVASAEAAAARRQATLDDIEALALERAHAEALQINRERDAAWAEQAYAVTHENVIPAGRLAELHAEALEADLRFDIRRATALQLADEAAARSSRAVECQLCGGPVASDGVCADDRCGDEDAPSILPAPEFPAGTPEYEEYATRLRTALKQPGAWDFLDVQTEPGAASIQRLGRGLRRALNM